VPISCHFLGCKVPLSSTVSGTISSELPLPLPSDNVGLCAIIHLVKMAFDMPSILQIQKTKGPVILAPPLSLHSTFADGRLIVGSGFKLYAFFYVFIG